MIGVPVIERAPLAGFGPPLAVRRPRRPVRDAGRAVASGGGRFVSIRVDSHGSGMGSRRY
ncbi:transketolase [Burkholderia mallei]|nr:transketolase [Burkholderia mallei]RKO18407.1 transketolase [Burkholderia mallei]RKO25190.1 transketolase [Burkholderia mallei]RKO36482.1 transketolase [Burkholderia mallei]